MARGGPEMTGRPDGSFLPVRRRLPVAAGGRGSGAAGKAERGERSGMRGGGGWGGWGGAGGAGARPAAALSVARAVPPIRVAPALSRPCSAGTGPHCVRRTCTDC